MIKTIIITLFSCFFIQAGEEITASVDRHVSVGELNPRSLVIDRASREISGLVDRISGSSISRDAKSALLDVIELYSRAATSPDSSTYNLGDNKPAMIVAYQRLGKCLKGCAASPAVPELFMMAEITALLLGKEKYFKDDFRRCNASDVFAFDETLGFIRSCQDETATAVYNLEHFYGYASSDPSTETPGPNYTTYLATLIQIALLATEPENRYKMNFSRSLDLILPLLKKVDSDTPKSIPEIMSAIVQTKSLYKQLASIFALSRYCPYTIFMPVIFDLDLADIIGTLPDGVQNVWLSGVPIIKQRCEMTGCVADGAFIQASGFSCTIFYMEVIILHHCLHFD